MGTENISIAKSWSYLSRPFHDSRFESRIRKEGLFFDSPPECGWSFASALLILGDGRIHVG